MVDICDGHEAKLPCAAGWGVSVVEAWLPGKGGKGRGSKVTWGRGMCGMKSINKLLGVSKMNSWFPAVVPHVISLPFDKVLILVAVLMTIKDSVNFIFKLVVNLDWFRGWRSKTVDIIASPGRETVDIEDWVLTHARRENKSVSEVTSALSNLVGTKLSWGEFTARMGSEDIFRTKPNLLAWVKDVRLGFARFEGALHGKFLHAKCGFSFFAGIMELL